MGVLLGMNHFHYLQLVVLKILRQKLGKRKESDRHSEKKNKQVNKMNIKKRIFNFIYFFVILPIAVLFTLAVGGEAIFQTKSILDMLLGLGMITIPWIWLILAYRYLLKIFDDKEIN